MPSHLTHEVVELATIALLVLVFTLLLEVFLPVSQISFTALLEEVDVSVCLDVSPTSSVVSEDVFSLPDELFSIIFILLIDATEDLLVALLSLILLSVEVLATAENCNGKMC